MDTAQPKSPFNNSPNNPHFKILTLLLLIIVIAAVFVYRSLSDSPSPKNPQLINKGKAYTGPEVWFFPHIPHGNFDEFNKLFTDEPAWAEARAKIRVWSVAVWWLGSPEVTSDEFLKETFLPALKRWNIKLAIESGPGVNSDENYLNIYGAKKTMEIEQAWWDRIRKVLGKEYAIDYFRLDSPDYAGLVDPGGVTYEWIQEETVSYIKLLQNYYPQAQVGIVASSFGNSGLDEKAYVQDVKHWQATLWKAWGRNPDFVDFEIVYDPSIPVSYANMTAKSQQELRAQGIKTGTWFVDSTQDYKREDPSGAVYKLWYEKQLKPMLIDPYYSSGFLSDHIVIGSYGPGPDMLPETKKYTLTHLVNYIAGIFEKRKNMAQ